MQIKIMGDNNVAPEERYVYSPVRKRRGEFITLEPLVFLPMCLFVDEIAFLGFLGSRLC